MTLGADGVFSVSNVPTDLVNLGIAAGVRDAQDGGRVVPSATTLYDVALAMEKPRGDLLGTTGYAVPTRFHDALTAAITPARIKTLTAANGMKGTLLEAGFILGRVVDANGAPVAGVTITPTQATLQPAFFYPTADLASTGASTSSNGLFVYVHNGGDVLTFRFSVANRPEYKQRNAGATKEACLVVTVAP
jgi:predicted extracellular nuclease